MLEKLWTSAHFSVGTNDSARAAPKATNTTALSRTKFRFTNPTNEETHLIIPNNNVKTEKITISLVGQIPVEMATEIEKAEPRDLIVVNSLPTIPLANAGDRNRGHNKRNRNKGTLMVKDNLSQKGMSGGGGGQTISDTAAKWDAIFHPSSTFEPAATCQVVVTEDTRAANLLTQKNNEIRTATLPNVYEPRPTLIRDSIAIKRSRDIDRYRVLYKVKYDNRKSRDSCITMDGSLSIRPPKTGLPRIKQLWHEFREKKQQLPVVHSVHRQTPKGQYFFWAGFACPIIWFVGSRCLAKNASTTDDIWRRRCGRAAVVTAVAFVCALIVVLITHPTIFAPRVSFKPPANTKVYGVD